MFIKIKRYYYNDYIFNGCDTLYCTILVMIWCVVLYVFSPIYFAILELFHAILMMVLWIITKLMMHMTM